MYVCLCHGVTRQSVVAAILEGACTSKAIAQATNAGSDCARCRRNLQDLVGLGVGREVPLGANCAIAKQISAGSVPANDG